MDPETGILKNLAGMTDPVLLEAYEAEMSILRELELAESPLPPDFDFAHLKALHRHLFQDVYAWAGEPRTVDISKGRSRFGSHLHVESYLSRLFTRLASEREKWIRMPDVIDWPERFAHYLGEINAAHPFREGNGRTQRLFIGQLARTHQYEILWRRMSEFEMIEASIASFGGDNGPLESLIRVHLDRSV